MTVHRQTIRNVLACAFISWRLKPRNPGSCQGPLCSIFFRAFSPILLMIIFRYTGSNLGQITKYPEFQLFGCIFSLSKPMAVCYLCNWPWRSIVLLDVEASTFCLDDRLRDGGEIVSPSRRPPFTPQRRFLVLISIRD
jgi:hypothetical protein